MTEIDFLQSMNDIDEDLLLAATKEPERRKKAPYWVRYALIAASLCVVAGATIAASNLIRRTSAPTDTMISFAMNDVSYEVADLDDYIRFGLVDEDKDQRATISIKPLTQKDLGAYMGTIVVTENGVVSERKAYHYIAFPDSEEICVVECSPGNYQIYVMRNLQE